MDKQANDSAFFSPQGVIKCQNIETMLPLMAMAVGISEHLLTSWSSFFSKTYAMGKHKNYNEPSLQRQY